MKWRCYLTYRKSNLSGNGTHFWSDHHTSSHVHNIVLQIRLYLFHSIRHYLSLQIVTHSPYKEDSCSRCVQGRVGKTCYTVQEGPCRLSISHTVLSGSAIAKVITSSVAWHEIVVSATQLKDQRICAHAFMLAEKLKGRRSLHLRGYELTLDPDYTVHASSPHTKPSQLSTNAYIALQPISTCHEMRFLGDVQIFVSCCLACGRKVVHLLRPGFSVTKPISRFKYRESRDTFWLSPSCGDVSSLHL